MTKIYPSWFLFLLTNMTGIMMITSSSNWLTMWVGFELTLLGFIPMFLINNLSIESMIKYMLIQASGSSMMLLSFMLPQHFKTTIILVSMLLKMGLFPFIYWIPTVMMSMNWLACLVLTTLQKVGPLMVMTKMQKHMNFMILLTSMMSILTASFIGMNQTQMKPLMAYSSIAHTSWMTLSLLSSLQLLLTYMLIYFWMNTILFTNLKKNNIEFIMNPTAQSKEKWKIILFIMVLSGIPPFSMFFMKMTIISTLMMFPLTLMVITISTMMTIFFYMSFILPNMVKPYHTNKQTKSKSTTQFLPTILIPTVMML